MLILFGTSPNVFILEIALLFGFLSGLALGIFLVKNTYGIEVLALLLKTPTIMVKLPGKIRERLKVWQEFRMRAQAQKIGREKEINRLNRKIDELKREIRKTKIEIRKIKWLMKEPLSESGRK